MSKDKNFSIFGYFKYFKKFIGIHMYGYVFVNFLVGLLDGLGLAMFIPLLSIVTNVENERKVSENPQILINFIEKLGVEFNLITALSFMISLFILKALFYYLRSLYYIRIRLKILRTLRYKLIKGLGSLSYEGFTKMEAGKIQNNMISEVGKMLIAMGSYFNTIQHIIMLVTYISLAFLSNWQFAIIVGIGGTLTNIFYRYVNKITKKYSRKYTLLGHDFNGDLIQSINHFKYLKATNYFTIYKKKMLKNIEKSEFLSYRMGQIGTIIESLREPLIIIIIASVIIVQINILGGSFSTILISLLLFYRSLAHLVAFQNVWNSFLGSSAAIESMEKLLDEFEKYEEKHYQYRIEHITDIQIRNVEVTYSNTKILENINLSIPRKTSIALVGESGAGKTTLANVICGLIEPHQGSVFTNGQNIYKSNLDNYRSKIGYIAQEPVIFDDSIFNNVTFWAEKTPENLSKFNRMIEMVSMKSFVDKLKQKEDTTLGHNGILISGGQKQRISIARELYKDVELMILDEATSALDSETEKYIKENIDLLHGKFSMLIIAHRLSTIKNVDKIYLLENGKITDSGTFNELVEKSDKFMKMVELQEI